MRARPADRGETLVGVMAAGLVLGALGLGLVNLWVVLDRLSFDLMLRQKAVFVLGGEMERLSELFAATNFGASDRAETTGYPEVPGLSGGASRQVHGGGVAGLLSLVTSGAAFAAEEHAIWVTGLGAARRNHVWLDRGRGLAARLSWVECDVVATVVQDCWDGSPAKKTKKPKGEKGDPHRCLAYSAGPTSEGSGGDRCMLVTLVLEYPFRVSGGAVSAGERGRVMTLSTVVGRRA